MTAVDRILDLTDARMIRAELAGINAAIASRTLTGSTLMSDYDRFHLWLMSTAARARLIELADVQRIAADVAMARWQSAPGAWVITTGLGWVT
jgi:hypothetical protein